jgi:tyrosine-protein phosphatase 2/3
MATAGISPASSPLPLGHHSRHVPRSPAVNSPHAARLHATHAATPKDYESSAPVPSTPRVRLNRQASTLTSTTPTAHVNVYSTGAEFPPHLSIDQAQAQGSPTYFNLTFNPNDSSNRLTNGLSNASSGAAGLGPNQHVHARANWSPPSSRVRSTAAASPRVMPVDQNPEFEAFRRQSEIRGQRALQSGFGFINMSTPQSNSPSYSTANAETVAWPGPGAVESPFPASIPLPPTAGSSREYFLEEKPRSPKRTLPSPYASVTGRPRRLSPADFTEREAKAAPAGEDHLQTAEAHFSLPAVPTQLNTAALAKAETLPGTARKQSPESNEGYTFCTPSHIVTLLDSCEEELLLLDLRVSVQYSRSRLRGALNICVPPLLLKRPIFNTAKLAGSLTDTEQRERFENWRNCKYIVVYDADSSKAKDALPCLNMLKKFQGEGWKGGSTSLLVVRGGFQDFTRQFPAYVAYGAVGNASSSGSRSASSDTSPTLASAQPGDLSIPPVIGGCPMPATVTQTAANPFFGNIRQNMDLIGGVGQIDVKIPNVMLTHPSLLNDVPEWLRDAAAVDDAGKAVAGKFLAIEKQEQKRMQEALSTTVHYGTGNTPGPSDAVRQDHSVKLAGIEKGSKNRYNNIWPYEHSRVKLEGLHNGECDYVNANHVKAAWSNKRYIATQGPIPSTFNDFWNMVWQQDVRVVVMLTAEKEGGQIKAHNYWSQRHFGPLTLNVLSEHRASLEPARIHGRHHTAKAQKVSTSMTPNGSKRRNTTSTPGPSHGFFTEPSKSSAPSSDQPYVTVRRFTLSSSEEPFERMREITHLQYSHWPDFGAPAHPAHLLGLVEQCDAVVRASSGTSPTADLKALGVRSTADLPTDATPRPVLVHCSAGCGRTGTFCTVDSVLDMLKRQRIRGHDESTKPKSGSPMDIDDNADAMTGIETDSVHESQWVGHPEFDLVEKTVMDFRLQRLSMVQSLRQYVLCYETVLEWIAEQSE